jgi:hypothetical protein
MLLLLLLLLLAVVGTPPDRPNFIPSPLQQRGVCQWYLQRPFQMWQCCLQQLQPPI